jgi:hypothetical protein
MFISSFNKSNHEHAVSIAYGADVPFSFVGHRDEKLAPTLNMNTRLHNGELSPEAYAAEYLALLATRGVTPEGVLAKHTDEVVFVCGENDPHRAIFTQWMNDGGVPVKEL